MEAIISERGQTVCLAVQSILVDTAIDLHFNSTRESLEAFNRLREINIRCYHVGENAPNGPYIVFYQAENRDTKFSFQ